MFKKIIIILLVTQVGLTFTSKAKRQKLDNDVDILFKAANSGDCKEIQKLIKKGVNINTIRELDGLTPLIAAICGNSLKAVKLLINLKADIEQTDKTKFEVTPLCWAANKGAYKIVKLLVEEHKANIEPKTKNNYTPLTAAIFAEQEKVAQYLIEHKADINIIDSYSNSLYALALGNGNYRCAKLLLDLKAPINSPGGNSALHVAAQHENPETLDLALKFCDVNVENQFGATALFCAAEANKAKNIELLIKAGAKVDYKSKKEATPLVAALVKNSRESAIELIKHKADIKDFIISAGLRFGEKPKEALKLLVDIMGKNYTDQNNQNFLHWAVENEKISVAEALIDLGVPYDQRDSNDRTPMDIALTKDQAFGFSFCQLTAKHQEKAFKNERKRLAHKILDKKLPKVLGNLITEYLD